MSSPPALRSTSSALHSLARAHRVAIVLALSAAMVILVAFVLKQERSPLLVAVTVLLGAALLADLLVLERRLAHIGSELAATQEDARLLQAADERQRQLLGDQQVLVRLASAAANAPDASHIHEAALDGLIATLGADRASILTTDEAGVMHFRAWRGISDEFRARFASQGLWSADDPEPQPVLVSDMLEDHKLGAQRELYLAEGVRAVGLFPLLRRGVLTGKLMVQFAHPHVFSEREVEITGAVAHHVGQALDRQRVADALRTSDERLRDALRSARMGAWDWDISSNRVTWSDNLEPLHGLAPGTFGGTYQSFLEQVHPQDRAFAAAQMGHAAETCEDLSFDYRVASEDGGVRWMEARGRVQADASSQAVGMSGTVMDVTERKEAEIRFHEQARLVATLNRIGRMLTAKLDIAAIGQTVLDEAVLLTGAQWGVFLHCEDPTVADQSTVAVVGLDAEAVGHVAACSALTAFGDGVVRYGDATREETRDLLGVIPVAEDVHSLLGVPVPSRRNKVVGGLVFGHPVPHAFSHHHEEITSGIARWAGLAIENAHLFDQLVRAEESQRAATLQLSDKAGALEEANRELSQYAYVVSHDLKTPLRAVHNYADFLRADLQGRLEKEQEEYLDGLSRAVRQAEELVDDLLDLSRVGSRAMRAEPMDIGAYLRDIAETAGLAEQAELVMPAEWPTIAADPTLVKQVFQNLMLNGVKFNRSEKKRVMLSWREPEPGLVEISVADNGIGIEPRHHEQIFGVFQRLHTVKEYEGTGIGLAIVRKAVSRLFGTVRLASEPGVGSTFTVTLPARAPEPIGTPTPA